MNSKPRKLESGMNRQRKAILTYWHSLAADYGRSRAEQVFKLFEHPTQRELAAAIHAAKTALESEMREHGVIDDEVEMARAILHCAARVNSLRQ
jgi:hypothetical protein